MNVPLTTDDGKPLPANIQRQIEHAKEQALIVLARRLLRARGRSTGQISVTVRELHEAESFRLVMGLEADRFTFDITRIK